MDYENMSDFEINKRVAESLGMSARSKSSCVNHGTDESGVSVGFGGCVRVFNPCNNPSDAWPIITENRISIVDPISLDGMWTAFVFENDLEPDVCHKNPLRAACIVYLMMQEAKC